MRKFIDRKPDKIKGIVCICIILAIVCAGNMIPNYLISLKAAKIAKTSTTISNADISPYSSSISSEERLTKMMSLMQDNVNELWNGKYSEKREPLDTEIPVGQAYTAIQTFLEVACALQKQSDIIWIEVWTFSSQAPLVKWMAFTDFSVNHRSGFLPLMSCAAVFRLRVYGARRLRPCTTSSSAV